MEKSSFLARCHPSFLDEDKKVGFEQYQALANDIAELESMGITLTLTENYVVGAYRYTNLADALAQARRMQSPGGKP